jgi:putative ABC transport system substrate-binding protein
MRERSACANGLRPTVLRRPLRTWAGFVAFAIGLGLVGAASLAPAAPSAAKPARIGVLFLASPETDNTRRAIGLREGLRDLGYVEGQSVMLEYQYAEGKPERLPELAAGLVRARVDVIVVVGCQAAMAARGVTATVPIVMAPVGDPIACGVVASLARPGGNVTGVSLMTTELIPKRLSLLKEVVPGLTRLGLVFHSSRRGLKTIEREAATMGIKVVWLEIAGPETIGTLRKGIRAARVHALSTLDHPVTDGLAPRVAEIALQERLPTVFPFREAVEAGGLMSYATSIVPLQRRAATYVHRILNGTSPAELPVEQADQFELVVNLKVARALRLTIPSSVLLQANQVID